MNLGEGSSLRLWHHPAIMSRGIMQEFNGAKEQVLGNAAHAEVVVSRAGLAALSAQT